MSRDLLRGALAAMGVAITGFGLRGVLRGSGEVPDGGAVSANVDSEYRFYAAWYTVVGPLLAAAARRPEGAATMVRAVGAGFHLAALGRVLSIRRLGLPHRTQRVLLAIEIALPLVLVPWQARVRQAASRSTNEST